MGLLQKKSSNRRKRNYWIYKTPAGVFLLEKIKEEKGDGLKLAN